MSGQLNELRLQVERLGYDNKESLITIDILKEQNQDAKAELEEFKKTIAEMKGAQKDASAEDKEKRKQEKMALMMAKFDAVRHSCWFTINTVVLILLELYSKAHSQRRTSSCAKFLPSWILSIPMQLYPRCRTMTSSLCEDS